MTMRSIITLVLVAILAACGSSTATLNYGDEKNPNRVTSVTGLKSHDAANTITYGAYTDAQVKKPQKAVCSLKARDGQTLNITGLAEFTCWAPETERTAGPVQAEGEAMQAARAIREGLGGTIKDATPALLGAAALSDRKDARRSAERIATTEAETERARDASQAAKEAAYLAAIEAANQRAAAAAAEPAPPASP
jgi:hypothetical protein